MEWRPTQGGEWVAGLTITREITETPEITNKNWCHNKCVEDL